MATHHSGSTGNSERLDLGEHAFTLYGGAMLCGVVGFVATILLGYHGYTKENNFSRFFYAYLVNYIFFLTLALGGLFFVLLQHITKAAWSVNVRRIAEWLASSMPLMAALSAPIVLSVVLRKGELYSWAAPGATDELGRFKQIYLSPAFFVGRVVFYFGVWSFLGVWYWKQSVTQDKTGDIELTRRMQAMSAPGMVLFGITLTFAAYDLIMSLDKEYGSTMFGVYIFAGSAIAIIATIILTVLLLQSRGYLRQSVTIEHFHDLGKFLFGFTFFWGYIGFSQYMLQWYANLPEETRWYKLRGASTVPRRRQLVVGADYRTAFRASADSLRRPDVAPREADAETAGLLGGVDAGVPLDRHRVAHHAADASAGHAPQSQSPVDDPVGGIRRHRRGGGVVHHSQGVA